MIQAPVSIAVILLLEILGGQVQPAHGAPVAQPATTSTLRLEHPTSIAIDSQGNLYIGALGQNSVFKLDNQGRVASFAGNGVGGFSGDGGAGRNASLFAPWGLAVDGKGNVLIADSLNHRVRRVSIASGLIATAIGKEVSKVQGQTASGPGLIRPTGIALEADGSILVVDAGTWRVYRVNPTNGEIKIVAGSGTRMFGGDGGVATKAGLDPYAVAVQKNGDIVIADSGNDRIRKVDADTGVITTIAGTGTPGFSGDGGPATSAMLSNPVAIAIGAVGQLYIADSNNHRVRKVDPESKVISTVAGGSLPDYGGDGGPAREAKLDTPTGLAVDAEGNVFIVDHINERIRRIDAGTGSISSVWALKEASAPSVTPTPSH